MKRFTKSTARATARFFSSVLSIATCCFASRTQEEENDSPASPMFSPKAQETTNLSSPSSCRHNKTALHTATSGLDMRNQTPPNLLALAPCTKNAFQDSETDRAYRNMFQMIPITYTRHSWDTESVCSTSQDSVDEEIDITGLSPPISPIRNRNGYEVWDDDDISEIIMKYDWEKKRMWGKMKAFFGRDNASYQCNVR